ncbi:hypothetical protein [Tuwongella immobilis]|uniref:hypothetical protein n=1 Tax=Tuwongella immobilis TaxID=692036 RepID=UPI001E3FA4C4|nr:hypothetical protein [Tuwongella immobilis]
MRDLRNDTIAKQLDHDRRRQPLRPYRSQRVPFGSLFDQPSFRELTNRRDFPIPFDQPDSLEFFRQRVADGVQPNRCFSWQRLTRKLGRQDHLDMPAD